MEIERVCCGWSCPHSTSSRHRFSCSLLLYAPVQPYRHTAQIIWGRLGVNWKPVEFFINKLLNTHTIGNMLVSWAVGFWCDTIFYLVGDQTSTVLSHNNKQLVIYTGVSSTYGTSLAYALNWLTQFLVNTWFWIVVFFFATMGERLLATFVRPTGIRPVLLKAGVLITAEVLMAWTSGLSGMSGDIVLAELPFPNIFLVATSIAPTFTLMYGLIRGQQSILCLCGLRWFWGDLQESLRHAPCSCSCLQ